MMTDELLNQLQELTQSADLSSAFESAIHDLVVSAYQDGYNKGYEECSFDMGDENV